MFLLAALQVSLAGWLVLVKLSSFADPSYSSKLWLESEYVLAKGRALPGVGESRGAAGVEQGWRGRVPAPLPDSFLVQGKRRWLGFSPKLRYYGNHHR